MADRDDPLGSVPDQGSDPVVWDPQQRRFVPAPEGAAGTPAAGPGTTGVSEPKGQDPRRYRIPPAAVGRTLPPQPGGGLPGVGSAAAPPPGPPTSVVAAPSKPPLGLPERRRRPLHAAEGDSVPPAKRRGRRTPRLLPHRPKLRRVVMLLPIIVPLLVIALLAAGLFVANRTFSSLHRVPVGATLDAEHGGTNILLVGSDTRDLQGIPASASGIFGDASNSSPSGQRSDTIMVLRFDGSGAHTLSVPRDLIVTIADTGKRDRVNSAYNTELGGGPKRLIMTVKDALQIPVNRYMEVDFATFQGVVDALGGIDIDFPHPASDENTGLDITTPGVHHLNGEQSLEYVRSRHYTELINGRHVEDPTADLGRVKRQQAFLSAVFGKIGKSRNPFTLLKIGGEVAKGLRVDDKLGFVDALRLGWDLKGLHPQPVELPVAPNSDNATLHLKPDADTALTQFR